MSQAPRDPDTGRFLPRDAMDRFDGFEEIRTENTLVVGANELDGSTATSFGQTATFQGIQAADLGDFLDRHEVGVPLWAVHQILAYVMSTETADGTIRGATEVSLSPDIKAVGQTSSSDGAVADVSGDFTIENSGEPVTDTADVLGPGLVAVAHAPFSDSASGVGGAGTPGSDEYVGPIPGDFVLDDRDDVFLNGVLEAQNIDDSAIHLDVHTYHLLGVMDDG